MVTTFSTSPTNVLSAQPNPVGEKLILRSTDASDTMNVTITGVTTDSDPDPDSETVALTGRREVQTTKLFMSVNSVTLASAATGIVTMYGQGVAGRGDVRIDTLPANGTTITLGLTGFTTTYTFKTTLSGTHATNTVSASGTPGDGNTVTVQGVVYTFKTALTGAAFEVHINGQDGSLTNLQSAINDSGGVEGTDYGTGTTANPHCTAGAVSSHAITLTAVYFGSGGNALTLSKVGTNLGVGGANFSGGSGEAANEIAIGASVSATATNLTAALTGGSGVALLYSTGTSVNSYLTASVLTSVVTLVDVLAIGRQIPWANTQSASYFTMRSISGATTPQAQATIRYPVTELLTAAVTLNTEDRTTATLPAGLTPTMDWVLVGGKRFTIAISTAQTGSALAFKYQTSQDRTTARDGDTSISITTTSGTLSNRDKLVTPSEVAEYVRLVVTSNPNTLDAAVNAKLISG